MYQISIKPQSVDCPGVFRWCLDYPRREQGCDAESLMGPGLVFQGWVLVGEGARVRPYVKAASQKIYLELDSPRPDVVRRVLGELPDGHPQLQCGFRKAIPLATDKGAFGFEIAGRDYDVTLFAVEGSLKILEGRDGWLFLDNDTNQSVEQYCGKLLLDRRERRAWRDYLESLYALAEQHQCAHAVLVAPAKEMVMSAYYPYPKGPTTPVEQVEKMARPKHRVVHPVERMQASQERMFRVCDTHWTHQGALCGLLAVLETLGLDTAGVDALFEQDNYKESPRAGDLGNKVFPRRSAREWILSGATYRKWVQYDNHLPNMGRVLITHKKDALVKAKCLIFGSSSSYTMLDYVARVFTDVVFVHSAGNVDVDVVAEEGPDFLVAQTNGRFVIRAPVVGYSLADEIAEKWSELSDDDRCQLNKKHAQWLKSGEAEPNNRYHALLPALS